MSGKATINVKEFKVEFGELRELKESRTIAVEVTSENIGATSVLDLGSRPKNMER